jgi:sugar phosphate isomerase/epimerase
MFRNLSPTALHITGRQSELIELALSYGFKGLDVDLVEFQQTVKSQGMPHARRFIDSARLKFGAFPLPWVWDEDDDVYKAGRPAVEEVLSLAAELGLSRAVVTISPANDLRPYHENFEFHRRRLTEMGEVLAAKNMKLGVAIQTNPDLRKDRAFQFVHSFDALTTMMGMIRTPNVGIVADLFQLHITGATFDELRKLGAERIISIVVSDAPQDKAAADCTDSDRLLPGETGTIDLPAVLVSLAEINYDGPITPAAAADRVKGTKREQIVRTAGERLTQAWTTAALTPAGKLPAAVKK